jgi:hypothetical protein
MRGAWSAGRSRLRQWNDGMAESAQDGTRRGTRWLRSSGLAVPALAVVAVLGVDIAQGALAATFTTSNTQFALKSSRVAGTGLGAFLEGVPAETGPGTTQNNGLARVGFTSVQLNDLCISVTQTLAGAQYTLFVNSTGSGAAGGNGILANPVSASYLYIDATGLTAASGTLQSLVLGQSADTVQLQGPTNTPLTDAQGNPGTAGAFGLQAVTANLGTLAANAYSATISGSVTLPTPNITIKPGAATC